MLSIPNWTPPRDADSQVLLSAYWTITRAVDPSWGGPRAMDFLAELSAISTAAGVMKSRKVNRRAKAPSNRSRKIVATSQAPRLGS